MTPRLLVDDDGHNVFSTLSEHYERDIDEVVQECTPNVDVFLLCCGAARFYYPTKVGAVDPRCRQLLKEHARGHDPFGYFLQQMRATGRQTYVTFRMNDTHNPEDEDHWNMPLVRLAHPECIVDQAAVDRGDHDNMNFALDYSHPAVAPYILAIIRELLGKYEMDGLQLDWMRFPRHFSGTPEEVWAKRDHLTRFTIAVRELTNAKGIRLIARVPTSLAGCRVLGTDIVAWTQRGLVDALTAGPFLTTDFFMPLQEMKTALGAQAVPVYASIEWEHGTQRHNPESLRAVATSLYASGADGISFFNIPCTGRHFHHGSYYSWMEGLESPATACRKPLLFSIAQHRHRKDVDLPGVLPLSIPARSSVRIPLRLPAAALPAWRARLLLHANLTCTVTLNGAATEPFTRSRAPELFLEYIDENDPPERRARREHSHSFRFSPELLRTGENLLDVHNPHDAPLAVQRVNLGLW